MTVLDALPAGTPLGDVMSGAPLLRPHYRKNWDNPVKYKKHPQGDEFEYANFAQFASRWKLTGLNASNFRFSGGSSIEWRTAAASGQVMYKDIPTHDFDLVLEYQRQIPHFGGSSDNWPGLALFNASGNGLAVGVHQNGNIYHNFISGFNDPGAFSGNAASGLSADSRHQWLNLRRVGNSLQVRCSNDGITFTAFTGLESSGVTVAYWGILRYRNIGGAAGWVTLHRVNLYPAPYYFPG